MDTIEKAAATHKAIHETTGGRQSKALRPGYEWGRNEYDDRAVVAVGTTNECLHHDRSWQLNGSVLICHECFCDCT